MGVNSARAGVHSTAVDDRDRGDTDDGDEGVRIYGGTADRAIRVVPPERQADDC